MTTQTLEQRVAHLEAELTRINSLLASNGSDLKKNQTKENWIDRLAGSVTNEALFLEALEYGKQYRQNS
jgi:hypothetical protein